MKTTDLFAERLSIVMSEQGVSQYALSKQIAVPQSTISRYISGKHEIGIDYLARICNALHVSSDYLLGLSDF